MKKIFTPILAILVFVFLYSCQKDQAPLSIVGNNPHNVITTGINSNVPRIDIRGGKMTVFLSVTDQVGHSLTGLSNPNFEISYTIDGITTDVPKSAFNVLYSTGTGTAYNILAALPMDYSGSMLYDTLTIPAMEAALKNFVHLKNTNDYMEIIKFSTQIFTACPFTMDTTALLAAIDTFQIANQSTALFQACLTGLNDIQTIFPTLTGTYLPAVIAFTDGVNNCAPLNNDSVISKAIANQIPIYSICYGNMNSGYPDTTMLKHLADTTGGRFYITPNALQLQELYGYVSGQLTSMYVITFPFGTKAGKMGTLNITTTYVKNGKTFKNTTHKTFLLN
jgi:hypothetical protein